MISDIKLFLLQLIYKFSHKENVYRVVAIASEFLCQAVRDGIFD